ncbi:condensation domain-containing protein [Streptomyces kaempferi]
MRPWLSILTRLAGRHAALRTAIPGGGGQSRQIRVERELAAPLLHWTAVSGDAGLDAADRLRRLLEPPFDLADAPLWRFELLDAGEGGQLLVFGAHHAVSDLRSLLLVAGEIDAELSGTPLGDTVSNRDLDLLIEAQRTGGTPGADTAEWREAFHGAARLDLTLVRPRPATRSYRAGSVTVEIPDGLMERVTAAASRLAVTPAAFCLGTLTVLLARARERERFVLAVPVDTRIHADAYDAVGFFGCPSPSRHRPGRGSGSRTCCAARTRAWTGSSPRAPCSRTCCRPSPDRGCTGGTRPWWRCTSTTYVPPPAASNGWRCSPPVRATPTSTS